LKGKATTNARTFYPCPKKKFTDVRLVRVDAVFFDLFDTLLPLESAEAYYKACLKKMNEFLAKKGVNVSFDDFQRAYFDIRDKFYSARESLEKPHFNVRVAKTLEKLDYNFKASDAVVVGATMSFADEFTCHVQVDEDAVYVLQKLHQKHKLGLISNLHSRKWPKTAEDV